MERATHSWTDRCLGVVAAATLLSFAAGCSSSARTSVQPSTLEKCGLEAAADPASFPADGGSGRLTINTERDCTWAASVAAAWVTLTTTSGQGGATINFTVAANRDPLARSASFTVNSREVQVTQQPGVCRYQLSTTSVNLPSTGGTTSIDVTASSAACEWRARSEADWIVLREGATGQGNGRVTVEAAATDGPTRSATVVVADLPVTVTQGEGCSYAVDPLSVAIPAAGGSSEARVETAAGCPWTAATSASWLAIASGAVGSGRGSVRVTVAAHSGPDRSATLTVAGRAVRVTQQSGCAVTLEPVSQVFPSTGGGGVVRVNGAAGCAWQAASNAGWIAIQGAAAGSGPGQVSFQVAPNTGAGRSGTLTIGGRTFTVNQSSGCSYTLSAASSSIPSGGGVGEVRVSAAAGCSWTAAINPPAGWIRINGATGGTGDGRVEFTVDANSGPARSAALTIAGLPFSVQQADGCAFSIAPTSHDVGSVGGTATIAVTTSDGCAWTAASTVDWITITAGASGLGPGTVTFTVAPNIGALRIGTITVAGHAFTVNQLGL